MEFWVKNLVGVEYFQWMEFWINSLKNRGWSEFFQWDKIFKKRFRGST